jgi:hypothetical protein
VSGCTGALPRKPHPIRPEREATVAGDRRERAAQIIESRLFQAARDQGCSYSDCARPVVPFGPHAP